MSNPRFEYVEVKLEDVLRHYSNGFEPQKGRTIESAEWFVDNSQGVVVFKLFTQDYEIKNP